MKKLWTMFFVAAMLVSMPALAEYPDDCLGSGEPSAATCTDGLTYEGCCDDLGRVIWCEEDGTLFCIDCANNSPTCGWQGSFYDCGTEGGEDPSGNNPLSCIACDPACGEGEKCVNGECVECVPDCDGKTCGNDGCGGTCGECGEGTVCIDDNCCTGDCTGKECGNDGCGGSCGECGDGNVCDGSACVAPQQDSCLGSCGDQSAMGECYCDDMCFEFGDCCEDVCTYCDELEGCGACTADCTDMECGDDGCGGSCGECDAGFVCDAGACIECTPDCTDMECGDDGCGGSCGECGEGLVCNAGLCGEPVTSCEGLCGGQADACYCDEACFENGDCCEDVCDFCGDLEGCGDVCEPDCEGKVCGDDGCEGSCGECTEGDCVEGQCVVAAECGNGTIEGDEACEADADCGEGEVCTDCACVAGCTPMCEGKECGDDGCGGTCGECAEGLVCGEAGLCVDETPIETDVVEQDVESDTVGEEPKDDKKDSGGCTTSNTANGTSLMLVLMALLAMVAIRRENA